MLKKYTQKQITFRIDESILDLVKYVAKRNNQSLNAAVNELLQNGLLVDRFGTEGYQALYGKADNQETEITINE